MLLDFVLLCNVLWNSVNTSLAMALPKYRPVNILFLSNPKSN